MLEGIVKSIQYQTGRTEDGREGAFTEPFALFDLIEVALELEGPLTLSYSVGGFCSKLRRRFMIHGAKNLRFNN